MKRLTLTGVMVLALGCPARGQDQAEINRNLVRLLERMDQRLDRHDAEIAALRREVQELRMLLHGRPPARPPATTTSTPSPRFVSDGRRFQFDWLSKQLYEYGEPISLEEQSGDSSSVHRLKHTVRHYLGAVKECDGLKPEDAHVYERRILSEYVGSIYYYLRECNGR